MPPPELPGDAPVTDLFHPLVVGSCPLFGYEPDSPRFHGLYPGFRERLRANEESLLPSLTSRDVALLYWTAAPWAALIALSKED